MALPGVSEIMFIAGIGPHPAADDPATIPSGASGRF
jgi:hypothetical protein